MVRSLLRNERLKDSSSLRFILLLVGICILLGSVAVWFGIADFDHRFSLDSQQQPSEVSFKQETRTDPYNQLQPDVQRIVNQAINGQEFRFESGEMQLPTRVRQGGTNYKFNSR